MLCFSRKLETAIYQNRFHFETGAREEGEEEEEGREFSQSLGLAGECIMMWMTWMYMCSTYLRTVVDKGTQLKSDTKANFSND